MTTEPAEQNIDINELFSRDPLKLTDDDIDNMIHEFRKKRAMFKANPASARKPAAPKKLTKKEESVKDLDIDLDL